MAPFDLKVLAAQLGTFLVGAAALWFIALKPIRKILEERRRRIDGEYGAAAAARSEAEHVQEELRGRVESLEEESRRRAKRAESEAAKIREEARRAARAEAGQILSQARAQTRRERAEMRDRIRKDVARLAVAMARKVTGKMLSREDHRRLVARVIAQLPAALSGGPRQEARSKPRRRRARLRGRSGNRRSGPRRRRARGGR